MAKRSVMREVFEKTNGRCWYCGTTHRPFDNWQIEHQNPRIRGGSDHISNLVVACATCNAAKGKRTVEEYRKYIKAKLENQITGAFEMASEIEAYVGWETRYAEQGEWMCPPGWLSEIESLLQQAAEKTVYSEFKFYGEGVDCIEIERASPVIEAETIT